MPLFEIDDDRLGPFRLLGRGPATAARHAAVLYAVTGEDPLAAPGSGRVLLAGDWHGNTGVALGALHNKAAGRTSTIIQLGDFGFWSGEGEGYLDVLSTALVGLGITLLVVDGNHEDYDLLERFPIASSGPAAGLRPIRPGLWHVPRGMRWSWPGPTGAPVRWVVVGGAASVDAAQRTAGVSWWAAEELTDEQADRIAASGPADVLLCHDRPLAAALELGDLPGLWHARAPSAWAAGDLIRSDRHSSRVQRVIDATQPAQVWHGHLHARTEVLVDPAAWGGPCRIHGLADDGQPGGNAALVALDGTVVR